MTQSRILDIGSNIHLDPNLLLGESIAVLGIKGSGKSNTAAVLAEEMLSAGIPICIVDIAGEYWGLKERYPILVAGKSAHVDIAVQPAQAASLAAFSLKQAISIILDVSDFRAEERMTFVERYFEAVWSIAGELRRPYQIFIEEAHNFIPQRTTTLATDVLVTIATEGRKRGLGIVMIGQRSARIDKDVLTQAGMLFLHRVQHPADIGVYQDIVPKARGWVKEAVNKLDTGQSIVLAGGTVSISQIRQRHTYHAGYTPGLDAGAAPHLQIVDEGLLSRLQTLLSTVESEETDSEKLALQTQLAQQLEQVAILEAELEEARATIERQKTEIEVLSHIRITVDVVPAAVANGTATVQQTVPKTVQPQIDSRERERLFIYLEDVAALSAMEKAVCRYFIQRPDVAMTFQKLQRHIAYNYGSLKKNPPLRSIELGLLAREGTRDGYVYRSVLDDALKSKFGSLPLESVRRDIIQALLPKAARAID